MQGRAQKVAAFSVSGGPRGRSSPVGADKACVADAPSRQNLTCRSRLSPKRTPSGLSGGAVYNDNGQLIGTCTGILPGSDISLAVPIVFSKALIRKAGFGKILDRK